MITTQTLKSLSLQFAQFFTEKDAEGIGSLLAEEIALSDPTFKVKGKKAVVDLFKKQFRETEKVSYEVVNAYEDENVGILEFKITMDAAIFYGVDFLHWKNGKMTELRCYYNPPPV